MNKLKMKLYAAIGLLVVAGVVAVGYGVKAFQSSEAVSNVFENVENLTVNQSAPESSDDVLGLGGPVNGYNWRSDGGVKTFYGSMAMNTATNTPCSFQSPAVTSTLTFGSATFDVSSSTASVVYLAKGNNSGVTTTLLGAAVNLAANEQGSMLATSTLATGLIFEPSKWFVVNMKGGDGGFSPTGFCKAEFKSLY